MGTAQRRTVSEIEPYHEQEPFLWDRHRYYGFVSGVGAGKTAVGVMRTALNAETWNPGEMGAIVAPSTQMIKNAIFPVMDEFGMRDKWEFSGFQAEEPGFSTPQGGRILILSAADERTVQRLANLNLSFWWLDEAKETPRRAREILSERLRKGEYRNGYITSTPKGFDHIYEFFVGDKDPEEYAYGEGQIYELEDKLAIVGVPSWANPHTPEDYHEEMRNLPDGLRAQQAEGQFVELGSGLLTRDMLSFIHTSEIPDQDRLKYLVGVDLGVEADSTRARERDSDYWSAALVAVNLARQEAYLIDVIRERGLTLKQGVSWLREICQSVPNPNVRVESVQAQRWLVQEARDAGLNVVPVDQSIPKEERIIQMSIPFETDSVQLVNREVDESLGYDPRWREFVSEWLAFPEGSHDDQLDSVEIALQEVDLGGPPGILSGNPYDKDNEDTDSWKGMRRK